MAESGQPKGGSILGDVKSAIKGIRGAGDALRGQFNESVDTAFQDGVGEAKDKAIKERGIADMSQADTRFRKSRHEVPTTTDASTSTDGDVPVTGAVSDTGSAQATAMRSTQRTEPAPESGVGSSATAGESDVSTYPSGGFNQQGTTTRNGNTLTTGGLPGNTTYADQGASTGAGAHSGGVGNLGSSVPQQGLGSEPAPAHE
ncbi:hypothetical protein PV10_08894 [Exophiala mesophila]|uniref:Uncharacterized protein n=1 Tax=Exophiala mesophila TaxID=212818 RepID=A0A0D1Z3G8_EXOME|nr:uncharacterized protein PV10_08894 [Exophiala mesophila]KIV89317.1 hypothetical protein PV10_08894 [Exophiala mesophila]